jgi:AcrR family transcriptional regulator
MPSATPSPDDEPVTPSQARSSLELSLELLWEGRPPAAKGPKPGLTLNQIVTMAVELADADGLEALSMRRLARELGVGTMTLYRYVPDKSVLLDLMLDQVSAPVPDQRPRQGAPWREVLEAEARQGRALYLRHPWLLQVNWTRPVLGPNTVAGLELTMASLTDLPMRDQEKIMVISELDAYVIGSVRQQVMYELAAEETGVTDEEFWGAQVPALERAMDSGDYPVLAAMEEDSFDADWEETFTFGLRHLLDGIEADAARREASASGT